MAQSLQPHATSAQESVSALECALASRVPNGMTRRDNRLTNTMPS